MPKLMQNGVDYTRPTHIMNKVINNYGSTNEETIKEVSTLAMNNRTLLVEKAVVVIEGEEYDSLEAFVEATDTEGEEANANGKFVIFTDATGWGPLGIANTNYKGSVIYQNYYGDNITESVDGSLMLYTNENITYNGYISGNKTNGVNINWTKIPSSTDLDELKKSVSDGKTLVADAITAKGVETATDATFATMAENIASIVSEATGGTVSSVNGIYITAKKDVTPTFTAVIDKYYLVLSTWNGVAHTFAGADIISSGENTDSNYSRTSYWYLIKATSETVTITRSNTTNDNLCWVFELDYTVEESSNINYIAPIYNSTQTYNEGDYVTYEDYMYECLEDGVTGEFDSTKWERTYLSESSLKEEPSNSNIKLTTKSITQPLIKKNQGINTFVFDFPHEVVGIVSITMPTLYNGYIQEIISIDGNVVTLKNYSNNEDTNFTLTVCGY